MEELEETVAKTLFFIDAVFIELLLNCIFIVIKSYFNSYARLSSVPPRVCHRCSG